MISIIDAFDYKGQMPDFSRSQFQTVQAMVEFSENFLPEVYQTYVVETGKAYRYQRKNEVDPVLGKWREVDGNVDLSQYYTKTQIDEKFNPVKEKAEANETHIGDMANLVVTTWPDLVAAINSLYNSFMQSLTYTTTGEGDEKKKVLRIAYRNGLSTDIDITAIVTDSNLGELKNVNDKDIGNKQVLAWDEGFQQYRPRTIDLAEVLKQAKEYTDTEIVNSKKGAAIAVDAKPTYAEGTITYKQNGVMKTTDDMNIWFYYQVDDTTVQTRWISGIEFTIDIGQIDLTQYVAKADVATGYTGEEIDKTTPASIGSIDDALDLAKEKLISDATGIKYENPNHEEWDTVAKALNGVLAIIEYKKPELISFSMSPATTVYEVGQSVSEVSLTWALNKEVLTQSLNSSPLDPSDRSATVTGPFTTNKTFTLICSDGQNSISGNKSISFQNKCFWGSAPIPTEYDSDFILGLANKQFATSYKGSFKQTVANGEYGYYCCPSSFNCPSETVIGGFNTDIIKEASFDFTNASGGVVKYDVFRTGKSGLGTITMEFK